MFVVASPFRGADVEASIIGRCVVGRVVKWDLSAFFFFFFLKRWNARADRYYQTPKTKIHARETAGPFSDGCWRLQMGSQSVALKADRLSPIGWRGAGGGCWGRGREGRYWGRRGGGGGRGA